MAYNSLMQAFVNNPDDKAQGFATCELCTNGTINCDANVYGGETPLIASHFHRASDDDGMNGNGPPVINFCGSNKKGMINDGTPYEEECMPYMSVNTNMTGKQVIGTTNGESIYDLVTDIGTYPEKFYLNFHSLASWSHWLGHGGDPMGMCRGVLVRYVICLPLYFSGVSIILIELMLTNMYRKQRYEMLGSK